MDEKNISYRLTFLRHGESVGNVGRYFQGQSDFPLTETGLQQARKLSERWQTENETFDLIIASPLKRARQTAEIVASMHGIPIEMEPLWIERDNGKLTGLKFDEVQKNFPQSEFSNIYQPFADTGEGDWELYLRAGQGLHKLLRKPPGRYLVVSHGGILNQLMYSILGTIPQPNFSGVRFRFANTGFSRFVYFPGDHCWQVETVNDHSHWKDAK